jgi:hypothetical protein
MNNTETGKGDQGPDHSAESKGADSTSAPGTEAKRKGGVEPAKRQAERDWQDSAKESGE